MHGKRVRGIVSLDRKVGGLDKTGAAVLMGYIVWMERLLGDRQSDTILLLVFTILVTLSFIFCYILSSYSDVMVAFLGVRFIHHEWEMDGGHGWFYYVCWYTGDERRLVKGEAGRGWSSLSSLGVALKGASSEESNKQLKLCYWCWDISCPKCSPRWWTLSPPSFVLCQSPLLSWIYSTIQPIVTRCHFPQTTNSKQSDKLTTTGQ